MYPIKEPDIEIQMIDDQYECLYETNKKLRMSNLIH